MTQRFEKLMEPGMIGPVKTRNRIIKTANGTSYVDPDQTVRRAHDRLLRAPGPGRGRLPHRGVVRGRVSRWASSTSTTSPTAATRACSCTSTTTASSPASQRLTDAVHKAGCPVSIQFQHAGPWNPTGLLPRDMSISDIKCASAMTEEELPGPDFLPCRAMTKQELEDQIDLWASAAERACKAGFDACEINHATAHQGNTFLSRIWNKREDEYGPQNYENRTRFIRNIIVEAKRRCGPGLRRHTPSSTRPSTTTRWRPRSKRAPRWPELICEVADGINVPRRALRAPGRRPAARPAHVPGAALRSSQGPRLEPAGRRGDGAAGGGGQAPRASRSRCGPPAASTPRWGEEYLREGSLDFVGMTRCLLADPEYPNKVARAGWKTSAPAWAACTASRCATATRSSSAG